MPKNLTKEAINNGAKMFLYLNSCPRLKDKSNIFTFFQQVFKKSLFEPTNTGIILYMLNAMKLFPNDGRKITSKLLKKVANLLKLSLDQNNKSHEIFTEGSTRLGILQGYLKLLNDFDFV